MYAMLCTRPDISYALSMSRQFQSNPGECNWTTVKNILKYLRRTKDIILVYGGAEELRVKGYTDASFQSDRDDFTSQSSFVFCLYGSIVKGFEPYTVTDLLRKLSIQSYPWLPRKPFGFVGSLDELGVVPTIIVQQSYCDNNGAIAMAQKPRFHQRVKHRLRQYHLYTSSLV